MPTLVDQVWGGVPWELQYASARQGGGTGTDRARPGQTGTKSLAETKRHNMSQQTPSG